MADCVFRLPVSAERREKGAPCRDRAEGRNPAIFRWIRPTVRRAKSGGGRYALGFKPMPDGGPPVRNLAPKPRIRRNSRAGRMPGAWVARPPLRRDRDPPSRSGSPALFLRRPSSLLLPPERPSPMAAMRTSGFPCCRSGATGPPGEARPGASDPAHIDLRFIN